MPLCLTQITINIVELHKSTRDRNGCEIIKNIFSRKRGNKFKWIKLLSYAWCEIVKRDISKNLPHSIDSIHLNIRVTSTKISKSYLCTHCFHLQFQHDWKRFPPTVQNGSNDFWYCYEIIVCVHSGRSNSLFEVSWFICCHIWCRSNGKIILLARNNHMKRLDKQLALGNVVYNQFHLSKSSHTYV